MWKDGETHGKGVLYLANGSKAEGEWKEGKPHGKIVRTLSDGSKYEEEYENGNFIRKV